MFELFLFSASRWRTGLRWWIRFLKIAKKISGSNSCWKENGLEQWKEKIKFNFWLLDRLWCVHSDQVTWTKRLGVCGKAFRLGSTLLFGRKCLFMATALQGLQWHLQCNFDPVLNVLKLWLQVAVWWWAFMAIVDRRSQIRRAQNWNKSDRFDEIVENSRTID